MSPEKRKRKMKITMTPSQRTTSYLQERGYRLGTTERHISPKDMIGPGYKKDLFGVIDLIAIRPGFPPVGVQSTGTDWSGHWKKILAGNSRPGALDWLATRSPLMLIGWRKLAAGYQPREHWFLPVDFLVGCSIDRHRTEQEWIEAHPHLVMLTNQETPPFSLVK